MVQSNQVDVAEVRLVADKSFESYSGAECRKFLVREVQDSAEFGSSPDSSVWDRREQFVWWTPQVLDDHLRAETNGEIHPTSK